MTVGLSPTRIVNVAVNLAPSGAQLPNLSTLLVLGTSTVIPIVQRMRSYTTLGTVAADFGTAAQEYLSAQAWFGQSPQPQSINIGRWAQAAAAGQLICAPLSVANTLISAWTGVTAGAFRVAVDGGSVTLISGMNFSSQTNLNGVASTIQTALQGIGGAFAAVTCVYNAVTNNFIITSGTTGAASAVSFLTTPGSGTDISGMMAGLVSSSGAFVSNGIAAESALAAVVIFDNMFGTQWYGLTIPSAVDADTEAVAPYIEGDAIPHYFGVNTQVAGVLVASSTTDIAYILMQGGYNKSATQYSSTSGDAIESYLARILTTQWNQQNSAITLFGKVEPGIVPEKLTVTQVNALEAKNCNVFVSYNNGTAILEKGQSCSGLFTDAIIGIDALRAQIATNLFNALIGTPTKVPQTDAGMHTLATAIQVACAQFANAGLIAPGVWNYQGFGQLTEGGYLATGFYVYAPPISQQSQPDRTARKSVAFQVAVCMAGAVQSVMITVTVSQ